MSELRSYGVSDIHRYLQQKMDAGEMYAFEKAMMDDPFLADAIEGYKQSNTSLANEHLLDIEHELNRGEEKTKVVSMPSGRSSWWKVAAVILLIVTGALGYLVWDRSAPNETSQIAQTDKNEKAAAESPVLTDDTTIDQPSVAQAPSESFSENKAASASRQAKSASGNTDQYKVPSDDMLTLNEAVEQKRERPQAVENNETDGTRPIQKELSDQVSTVVAPPSVAAPKEVSAYGDSTMALAQMQTPGLQGKAPGLASNRSVGMDRRTTKTNESMLNRLSGQVTDSNGRPVPGATISATQLNTVTTTDSLGYFNITSPYRNSEVVVNAFGYVKATAKLNSDSERSNIMLKKNSNNLDEVVVVGYGSQKRSAVTGSVSTVNKERTLQAGKANVNQPVGDTNYISAAPRGGWKNFNEYVTRSIVIGKEKVGKRDVVLEFTIDDNGLPSGIKVLKTVNRADSLEAARILRNGPVWDRKNKNARVAYSFSFTQ